MKINRGDYPKLHLDTNYCKGTACNRKGYGCKWTWETVKHNTWTQIIVREQRFYCTATFNSLCRIFNNEHNSYHNVRATALAVERYSMIFVIYNCIAQMRGNQHIISTFIYSFLLDINESNWQFVLPITNGWTNSPWWYHHSSSHGFRTEMID